MRGKFTFLLVLLTLFALSSTAGAIDLTGKKGINLNVGAAELTQDFGINADGKTGPIVGGRILYGINKYFTVGFEVEWEKHEVKTGSFVIGDYSTVSLLPLVQLRSSKLGQFSPFMTIGVGYNINSFDQTALVNPIFNLELDDTLAIKGGVGFDYFFTDSIAVNFEANWKLNSTKFDSGINGWTKLDADATVITFSGGVSLYF